MSVFTRKLLSKQTHTPPSSSSSKDSIESYHETIDKTTIDHTLNFVLKMQQAVLSMKKQKMSIPLPKVQARIPIIDRVQSSSRTSHSNRSEMRNKKTIPPHRPMVTRQYEKRDPTEVLEDCLTGKKVYLDFIDADTVQVYDEQNFSDLQDGLGMKKSIETHQKASLEKYRQILNRSERSILTQRLDRILWDANPTQQTSVDNNAFDPYGLIRQQRRQDFYLLKHDEAKPSSAAIRIQQEQLNKLARIKKKADNYIIQKFKHTGFMVQSLSNSIKLKPINAEPSDYQYPELIKKQNQVMKKARPNLGRQNRGFLKYDMEQISNFLKII